MSLGNRIAAIDYGRKRIGYAISDPLKITARPKTAFQNTDKLFDEINAELIEDNVELVVIGKPERNDVNSKIVDEIEEFAVKLKEITGIDNVFFDESYSSKNAIRKMIESGRNKKFRREKSNTDTFAAAIILEEYLNSNE
mgnify:CR=1 FL=1